MKNCVTTAGILFLFWTALAHAAVRESVSLDGTWSFATDPESLGETEQWFLPSAKLPAMPLEGYAPEADGTIQVPGMWDNQGYGAETDKLTHYFVGCGWYKRTVTVPADWHGEKIYIVLGGISRCAQIWVNGKPAGDEAIGCIGIHERDITDLVQYGAENDITIRVDCKQRWDVDTLKGGANINDYMELELGGLWGHVTLEARPTTRLDSIYLRGNIHENSCTAETFIISDVPLSGKTDLLLTVFDREGRQVAENRTAAAPAGEKSTVSAVIPDAQLWSPETPCLYKVVVTLLQNDIPADRLESSFGLRELKFDGVKILLNGERIFLAGYGDDHIYPAELAMTCDKNVYLERLKKIKSFGFNHVRNHSAMLPDEYYQACDEVGILPTAEFLLGYERYAPGDEQLSQFLSEGADPLGGMPVYLDRFAAVVKQYRNHPSIAWWVAGNELYAKDRPFAEPFRQIVLRHDADRAFVLSDGCSFTDAQHLYQPVRAHQFQEWGNLFEMPWKYDVPDWNTVPVLIHEAGNYLSFPRLDQVDLFNKTVYKPFWFAKGVETYKRIGLYEETDKWVESTEKQYLFTNKYNFELARRNDKISGYHWWLIQDYFTTSNGILDPFFREKSYRPEDILPFNSSVVLIQSGVKFCYRGGEELNGNFMISNFSRNDLPGTLTVKFSLDGKEFKTAVLDPIAGKRGGVSSCGAVGFVCPEVKEPVKMTMDAVYSSGDQSFNNSWSRWIYPKTVEQPEVELPVYTDSTLPFLPKDWSFKELPSTDELPADAVYLVSSLDTRIVTALERGARVLYFGELDRIPSRPITWQSSWWKAGDDIVMGPYTCGNHLGTYVYPNSVTDSMVRDSWCDISWYELINGSCKDIFPPSVPQPEILIRTVSSIVLPENSSLLYQAAVGKGKLVVSKLNHHKASGLPQNDWLCKKLLESVSSASQPSVTWPAKTTLPIISAPAGVTVGFKKAISAPEPPVISWSYRGDSDTVYIVRQNAKGKKLVWNTQAAAGSSESTRRFIFAGILGFHDEPATDGFLLALNDRPVLRFDLVDDNKTHQWKSEDGSCELKFDIKRTIGDPKTGDHYGEFTLVVPADRVTAGQSQTLSVESLGENSRRWFGLNPFTNFCTTSKNGKTPSVAFNPIAKQAEVFDFAKVQITDPEFVHLWDLDHEYLLSLDTDRLLNNFRVVAGIESHAPSYGGWEDPSCGVRGNFVGHYMAACSKGYRFCGDRRLKEKLDVIVDGLAECQNKIGTGYLSGFPESSFDLLEEHLGGPGTSWAPYCTIHKIMSGLLDAYEYGERPDALDIVCKMADYFQKRIDKLTEDHIERMLKTTQGNPLNESSGMSDVFHRLARLAKNPKYLNLAHTFDRDWFFIPLSHHQDMLEGLHSNTHVPVAIGGGRHYELTGDTTYRDAVEFFWKQITQTRSYAHGGSSGPRFDDNYCSKGAEHWPPENKIAASLTNKNAESCVSINMLRLTSMMSTWQPKNELGNFYERVLFNHVRSMEHPNSIGRYIYHLPLISGSRKDYGTPDNTFWCCHANCVEEFASLVSDIYYKSADTLFVNLFIASKVDWNGIAIEQKTDWGKDCRLDFIVNPPEQKEFSLCVRQPDWSDSFVVEVNGDKVEPKETEAGLQITRIWNPGDRLTIRYPMSLIARATPDDPNLVALYHGPFVQAIRSDAELVFHGTREQLVERARETFELVPLYKIVDEHYGVYIRLKP